MVEIFLSPDLRMNGRNIFHYIFHYIFNKPCEIYLANEWSKYFSTDFQQTCEISCVGLLRKSIAYEWSKHLYHQTLRKSIA